VKNLGTVSKQLLAGSLFGTFTLLVVPSSVMAEPYWQDEPKKPVVEKKQEDDESKEDDEKKDPAKESDKDGDDEKKEKPKKLIADVIEDHELLDGLFTLYRDPKTGSLSMEVREDQIGKEYIYFSHAVNGVVEGGHFRGQFRRQKVFTIEKRFNKIAFIEKNPYFYFDPASNLAKAENANISDSVLYVNTIKAQNEEDTSFLINADSLFKSEAFDQVKRSKAPGPRPRPEFSLGKLSGAKTYVVDIKNYPENTAVTVEYVYSNPSPVNTGNWFDITDARNVTVGIQHTLVAMPENDYKPRFDDARIGYFLDYVNDQTSQSATPWRDMINRWNLVKKDPSAAISEPIEPIVWWIENTTPENLRPIIKAAAEAWNPAFEAAGFKNALQVKIQPDDAEWDAGDIRYNVLRWTSSPQPPFGGYGPSFTNPRTGQILAADIMLEYSFLTNRINAGNIFETGAVALDQAQTETEAHFSDMLNDHAHMCNLAAHLQHNTMLGKTLATVMDKNGGITDELVEEALYYLILHELGHTLGLTHNMKATQARSYETTHDISQQDDGLAGSVMDYPSINFAPSGKKQAHYYTIKPGTYDYWAIKFGYAPEMDDPSVREAWLARSNEKALSFGLDADDMRSPGRGIDPRVNIYDMTDDAVRFAEDRMKLSRNVMQKLRTKFTKQGASYQELRNAYLILTNDMAWQGRVASRYIGGVYVERSVAGQPGETAPYRPVEKAKQKQAMRMLREYILAPEAFAADPHLLQHLAIQRRGFLHGGRTEDPKIHNRVAIIQADILNHILHPVTMLRISDSALYGNSYSVTEVLGDLTNAIFEDDSRNAVNSHRQELQTMYVNGLITIFKSSNYNNISRSNAFSNLRNIRNNMARWRGDAATRAHRDHIAYLINKALEVVKD
jgi:hypothetical protein